MARKPSFGASPNPWPRASASPSPRRRTAACGGRAKRDASTWNRNGAGICTIPWRPSGAWRTAAMPGALAGSRSSSRWAAPCVCSFPPTRSPRPWKRFASPRPGPRTSAKPCAGPPRPSWPAGARGSRSSPATPGSWTGAGTPSSPAGACWQVASSGKPGASYAPSGPSRTVAPCPTCWGPIPRPTAPPPMHPCGLPWPAKTPPGVSGLPSSRSGPGTAPWPKCWIPSPGAIGMAPPTASAWIPPRA